MPRDNSESTTGANRRNFLATAGAIGSSVILTGFSQATPKGKVEIVVTKRGDEPVRTKEVPKEWYSQFSRARDKREQVANSFANNSAVADVRLETADERIETHKKGKVVVLHYPDAKRPSLPDIAPDIPTEIREYQPKGEPLDSCGVEGVKDPVTGGWELEEEGGTGAWSSGCQVTNEVTGATHMGTCAHAFSVCSGDPSNEGVVMSDADVGEKKVGEPAYTNELMDFAAIEQTSDSDISGFASEIYRPDANPNTLNILGHITEDGLGDIAASGETVYKTGERTCTTEGEVTGMYISNNGECDSAVTCTDYVEASMNTDQGDSGSPYYVKRYNNDFNRYMAEIVVAAHRGHESIGIGAYYVNQETDYRFP